MFVGYVCLGVQSLTHLSVARCGGAVLLLSLCLCLCDRLSVEQSLAVCLAVCWLPLEPCPTVCLLFCLSLSLSLLLEGHISLVVSRCFLRCGIEGFPAVKRWQLCLSPRGFRACTSQAFSPCRLQCGFASRVWLPGQSPEHPEKGATWSLDTLSLSLSPSLSHCFCLVVSFSVHLCLSSSLTQHKHHYF